MPIEISSLNYLAILVAAIAYFVIGALWYSVFFGRAWIKAMGLKKTDIEREKNKGSRWKAYFANFLTIIVMVYVLAIFIRVSEATNPLGGMFVGFLIWLGFIATVSIGTILWEGKPLELYLINASYHLVSLNVAGIILTLM